MIAALLDGAGMATAWLIPAGDLAALASRKTGKLVMTASPKPASRDKYAGFRRHSAEALATALIARIDPGSD
ncbi:MAG: hypothetical protein RIC04_14265 [Parvibaculum sp.]|uniref:hypothetical protein n=1 Tax=Parvibaculum sp. TaxID=2024848 RepID=UPI0032EBF97B